MSSFNRVTGVANLGRDVELRYTPGGDPIANFTVATTDKSKKNGEVLEVTTWFRLTFFGKQAELIATHFRKGDQIYFEGKLRQEEWTDKDGNPRTSLEVRCNNFEFVGKKSDREGGGDEGGAPAPAALRSAAPATTQRDSQKPAPGSFDDSDIPF